MYFSCHGKAFAATHLAVIMTDSEEANLAGTAFDVGRLGIFLAERDISIYVLIFDCCRLGTALHVPGLRPRGDDKGT